MSASGFFDTADYAQLSDSAAAASRVLPFILEILPVESVVDFGCGSGGWCEAAAELGIGRIVGVDGPMAQFPPGDQAVRYHTLDLTESCDLGERFDLGICLEVAEHIHEDFSDHLLTLLTRHSDHILFSAAIPGQQGTGHVNCQWLEYWIRKFEALDYEPHDVLRFRFWDDGSIPVWYRQNMILFARRGSSRLAIADKQASALLPLSAVHPDLWLWQVGESRRLSIALAETRQELWNTSHRLAGLHLPKPHLGSLRKRGGYIWWRTRELLKTRSMKVRPSGMRGDGNAT